MLCLFWSDPLTRLYVAPGPEWVWHPWGKVIYNITMLSLYRLAWFFWVLPVVRTETLATRYDLNMKQRIAQSFFTHLVPQPCSNWLVSEPTSFTTFTSYQVTVEQWERVRCFPYTMHAGNCSAPMVSPNHIIGSDLFRMPSPEVHLNSQDYYCIRSNTFLFESQTHNNKKKLEKKFFTGSYLRFFVHYVYVYNVIF